MWARILVHICLVFGVIIFTLPAIISSPVSGRALGFGVTFRVVENSGICETTHGVQTVSGYMQFNNSNYFFWFFSNRQDLQVGAVAPTVLWFNGGPGCSSMKGLFQGMDEFLTPPLAPPFLLCYPATESGPCKVNSDKKSTTLNPNSWNKYTNVLYIDQPIGTGFSHGTETANDDASSAVIIWALYQAFLEAFPQYKYRRLILATDGYGAHYALEFVKYSKQQNERILSGAITAEYVFIGGLMLNNGWIDPAVQYLNYPGFAAHPSGYNPMVTESVVTKATSYLLKDGGCMDQIAACNAAGSSNKVCSNAYKYCYGDADYTNNWLSGLTIALGMEWWGKTELADSPFHNVTISTNGIGLVGEVVSVGRFSLLCTEESQLIRLEDESYVVMSLCSREGLLNEFS
ncbi:hypothetical protein FRB98_005768 [Tulasnella sp. 332]|nr:hypothetical protein FRB98_005768 [Tulasnella sp. 332]